MEELSGVTGTPYKHPQVRRKVPVFSRPRIDLDGGRRVQRSWQDTSVLGLKKGDTVAQFGTIAEVVEFIDIQHHDLANPTQQTSTWRIRLYNVMGDYQDYPGEQRVFAFTPDAANEQASFELPKVKPARAFDPGEPQASPLD